jgi:zinc protease
LSGRASEFEQIAEQLRTAIISTPLTVENLQRIRDARIKSLIQNTRTRSSVADALVRQRLFVNHPYSRSIEGTAETLAVVDLTDLANARDRFLNPNNAELVLVGGVDPDRAMRFFSQTLGPWRKSDAIVPPTFRIPAHPDRRVLVADFPSSELAEIRVATIAPSRRDKRYSAARLLSIIAQERWRVALSTGSVAPSSLQVRYRPHVLPGTFELSASVRTSSTAEVIVSASKILSDLAAGNCSAAELARAKSVAIAELSESLRDDDSLASMWLTIEALRLDPVSEQVRAFDAVTLAQLQSFAAAIFKESEVASVAVGNADQISQLLTGKLAFQVFSEPAKPSPARVTSPPSTSTPAVKPF